MRERMSWTDDAPRQAPLPYGAVPLAPWRAFDHERPDLRYSVASIDRVRERTEMTMREQGWFEAVENAGVLLEFMQRSVVDSQVRRIDKNYESCDRLPDNPDDERIRHALLGTATPEELFTLLADYPQQIRSLELAKLSHPFDFEATAEMDDVMTDLLLGSGGELLDTEPRFKIKRVDADVPAAVVLCKQELMDFRMDTAIVRVVQRQGYMVFHGNGMPEQAHIFKRLISRPEKAPMLIGRMSAYLENPGQRLPYGWVQPQATSYYAKYVSTSLPI